MALLRMLRLLSLPLGAAAFGVEDLVLRGLRRDREEVTRRRRARTVARTRRIQRPARNLEFALALQLTIPPEQLFTHRVWLGIVGVLAQLNAEVPVRPRAAPLAARL